MAQFAHAIKRNWSVVCTWLAGRASPSWRALCEISFVFQVPVRDLFTGDTDAVALSSVRPLPLPVLDRVITPRKLPQRRSVDDVCAFLGKVARGELPNVLTLKEVGVRLGAHPRELARIAPTEVARLSATLAERRKVIRERNRAPRLQVIDKAVDSAVDALLQSGRSVTRRAVDKELAALGPPVRRREAPIIQRFVQTTLAKRLAGRISGNKRAADDSGN